MRFDNFAERDVSAEHHLRQRFGKFLANRVRHCQHPRGILKSLFRLDCVEGHDLRNPVGAIFCGHISNDFTTATIIEVDIDIWQRNTFRVQEALKNQSVLNWVKIRDSHRPGNYRPSCRSTTGPNSNAIVSSPGDEVGDYKEVTRKTHSNNNFDLKLGLVLVSLRNLSGETLGQPNLNLLGKPTCLGFTFRNRKSRHQLAFFEGDFRTLGDQ